MRRELAPEAIISGLRVLRAEGYEVLSLSGGEPLLYSGFETVVKSAAHIGFRINLITNGASVGGRLLDLITEHVSMVAVSLDGAPETHGELRGNARAFFHAERALDRLVAKGVKCGIAYCVSRESLADMPWAVDFAAAKGASFVQFHPFAATGRGQYLADRLCLSATDMARAYLIGALLDAEDGVAIQIDIAPVELARTRRSDYPVLVTQNATGAQLSELANPLIIDESGSMFPFSYGINERFMLGQLGPNLLDLVASYKKAGWRDLRTLLNVSFDGLGTDGENFVDWFYRIVETSHAVSAPNCHVPSLT